jgi:hypothetical protein
MKLWDFINEDELNAQIEAKMVKATPHPSGKLLIYNYTQMASFTPELWNHVTDKCRGLIVDIESGDIVSRPFEKFWNLNDARHPETLMENLPSAPPTLTRKMDGSLGILYWLDGMPAIATRGSFTSEQAIWATKWIREHATNNWPDGFTPLFEIVFPENQIVVRYDYSGLVLLAMVQGETGEEMEYWGLSFWAEENRVRVVEKFDKPLVECVAEDEPNEEGYVAAWDRLGTTPLRCKVKYQTYVRLHRLLTQTNAVTVWEMLRDGLDVETLTEDVPNEFRAWIDGVEKRLRDEFKAIEDGALAAMLAYPGEKNITDKETKKAFAIYVTSRHPKVAPIMFAMVEGKKYAPIIWKQIRPRGDDRTFRVDVEG